MKKSGIKNTCALVALGVVVVGYVVLRQQEKKARAESDLWAAANEQAAAEQ